MNSGPTEDDLGTTLSEADSEIRQQHSDSERLSQKKQKGSEGSIKTLLAIIFSLIFIVVFVWQYPRFSEPFSHLKPKSELDVAQTDLVMLGDTIRRFQLFTNALPASLDELDTPVSVGSILQLPDIEYRPSGVEFRLTATVGNQRIVYDSGTGLVSVSN